MLSVLVFRSFYSEIEENDDRIQAMEIKRSFRLISNNLFMINSLF